MATVVVITISIVIIIIYLINFRFLENREREASNFFVAATMIVKEKEKNRQTKLRQCKNYSKETLNYHQ